MDVNLYNRIVQYTRNIMNGGELPWQGLWTAKGVYQVLREAEIPLSPEEIGNMVGISSEYANQIVLALQNGGCNIRSVPFAKSWTGRPASKYLIE